MRHAPAYRARRAGRLPTLILFGGLALAWFWQQYREQASWRTLSPTEVRCRYVVDGDTVDVVDAEGETRRVRLLGIDCPETHNLEKQRRQAAHWRLSVARVQALGQAAEERTSALLGGRVLTLVSAGGDDTLDAYGRWLAYLEDERGDVGAVLLAEGLAEARGEYHPRRRDYRRIAEEAARAGRGIHGSR